jgi:Rrf2 family transcriptional regulator, iron-sulfur cluster assembly transcription factor
VLYSKPCEYAIRALAFLARTGRVASGEEIARAEKIPAPVLAKLLQVLARKGLLDSRRGPGGGFRLARPAAEITLCDVVAAVDGLEQFRRCAVGLPHCSDESPCPVHDHWKGLRSQLLYVLETTTVEQMARAVTRKKNFLRREQRRKR